MTTDKRGCNICSIHEFTAPFLGKPAHYKVTSVVGHVYRFVSSTDSPPNCAQEKHDCSVLCSTDFAPQYQNWANTDPLDLFTCPIRKVESDSGVCTHHTLSSHNETTRSFFGGGQHDTSRTV